MHKSIVLLASFVVVSALALPAFAQEGSSKLDEPYLSVGLMLGFAGEAEIEGDGATADNAGVEITSGGASAEADVEVSFGGGVQYIHPLHRYFALGGRLAVLSWRSEAEDNGDRNLVFDLSIVPQLRVPLSAAVELYLSVPIGVSLNLLNELDRSASFAGVSASVESDPGFGLNLSTLLGARFALALGFGLFTELGYSLHSVSHEVNFRGSFAGAGGTVTADVDVSWWQVAWNAGVYF